MNKLHFLQVCDLSLLIRTESVVLICFINLICRCPYMAIQEADESDTESEAASDAKVETETLVPCAKNIIHKVEWIGEKTQQKARSYYETAKVGGIEVRVGDYVMLNSTKPNRPLNIARICSMWQEFPQGPTFHAHLFCRGSDTLLGETSDPQELFVVDMCENCPLGSIVSKAQVFRVAVSDNWSMEGGLFTQNIPVEDDGRSFFYSKQYDCELARFEYLEHDDVPAKDDVSSCLSCM